MSRSPSRSRAMYALATSSLALLVAACSQAQDCSKEVFGLQQQHTTALQQIVSLNEQIEKMRGLLSQARIALTFKRSSEGYGKTRWGMSPSEVKQLYKGRAKAEGKQVLVEGKFEDYETATFFSFAAGRLSQIVIEIKKDSMYGKEGFREAYQNMLRYLVDKHGPPATKPADVVQEDGKLVVNAWHTGKTDIEIKFVNDDVAPGVQISYSSPEISFMNDPLWIEFIKNGVEQ